MDNSEIVTSLEWCAGYGGIGLGLKRVLGDRLRCIAYSDVEGFCQANLISKMEAGLLDAAPIWPNLKTFPCKEFHGLVDIFVAGYPCQPFSHAGQRLGAEDPRHLWPFIQRAIKPIQPRYCFFENVAGHVTLGFKDICHDLDELGYEVTAGLFSASEVSAPHKRLRLFILAHCRSQGHFGWPLSNGDKKRFIPQQALIRPEQPVVRSESEGCGVGGEAMAYNRNSGCEDGLSGQNNRKEGDTEESGNHSAWPSRPGEYQYGWEAPRVVAGKYLGDPADEGLQDGGEEEVGGQGEQEQESERPDSGCGSMEDSEGIGREVAGDIKGCPPEPSSGGEIKSDVGLFSYGTPAGLDLSRYTGLSDTELAEIREWMVKGANRTDELRMCGNGVVPQTAERAWLTLYSDIIS